MGYRRLTRAARLAFFLDKHAALLTWDRSGEMGLLFGYRVTAGLYSSLHGC